MFAQLKFLFAQLMHFYELVECEKCVGCGGFGCSGGSAGSEDYGVSGFKGARETKRNETKMRKLKLRDSIKFTAVHCFWNELQCSLLFLFKQKIQSNMGKELAIGRAAKLSIVQSIFSIEWVLVVTVLGTITLVFTIFKWFNRKVV